MDRAGGGGATWSGTVQSALRPVLHARREGPATLPALRRRGKGDDLSLRELPPLLPSRSTEVAQSNAESEHIDVALVAVGAGAAVFIGRGSEWQEERTDRKVEGTDREEERTKRVEWTGV